MELQTVCNRNDISGKICSLLQDESCIHLAEFKRLILQKDAEREVDRFVYCTNHCCAQNNLDKFFSYFRLIGDAGILGDHFNRNVYSIEFLESYILYLIGQDIMEFGSADTILDRHLPNLSGERLVEVLFSSTILSQDVSFFVQCLSRFSNREIDQLISRSEYKDRIMHIFRFMPVETVFSMVLRTPEIYHYAILFFELEGDLEGARRIESIWSKSASTSSELRGILKILSHPDLQVSGLPGMDRGRMASVIASLVIQTSDPCGVWEILEASAELNDPDLRAIIRSLVMDEGKRAELGFKVRVIDVNEILNWMESLK